jgi:pimeloyl-ACP methyl ester carboxylesterase
MTQDNTEASTSRYATIDGMKVHYNEVGAGPALILLHGGGPGASGWSNFKQNVPELSRHFRVLLIDQPGYGKSDKVIPEKEARSELASRLIAGLLDQLSIKKAHVLGNSFGGRTAIQLALRHAQRVDRLILMGPAGGSLNIFSPEPTEGMKHLHGFFSAPGPSKERMREFIKVFVHDQTLVTDALIDERFAAATEPETRRFYEHFLSKPDAREPQIWREIDKIQHRTLLVWGRDDRTNPFEGGIFMLKRMFDARLHVFPRCGHWAQLEHRDEFNALLRTFLDQPGVH